MTVAPEETGRPDRADIHPLTLRFASDALEERFLRQWQEQAVRHTRAVLLLTIYLYGVYALLDWAIFPQYFERFAELRAGVCALTGAVFAATYFPWFPRARTWLLSLVLVVATAGVLAMLATGSPRVQSLYFPGIVLIILGAHALFRLRFPLLVALSVGILISYDLQILLVGTSRDILMAGNFALVSATLMGLFASYNLERYARIGFWKTALVEEERERSERLLLNILPGPIARRLKSDPGPLADAFDEASILFADLVGFTELSSTMPPEELVRFLNSVFTEFDQVARRYGIEKIKTIGDAYMAVAGVPVAQPDHVERIAEAALAMRGLVERHDLAAPNGEGQKPIALRFGIATGPVVAGVVGESKFIYDLWGDTVTTASRMESHGQAGWIQVTEPVYERLHDRYAFRPLGTVPIKGKGSMPTYLLEGRLETSEAVSSDRLAGRN
ncbi:MAG TPA: adenylate/guanylate cyclase domain-containing protein [Gemmatimonadota bacterium]|nr:adenylate/guanylate cyclase domain-containing protein [Gemmatimonadota bacterium]